jgi:aminopeptidase-like protein
LRAVVWADQRRLRRLFAVLEDVADYTAGYGSTKMLAQAWDMIGELVLQIEDAGILTAVAIVGEHEVGSSGWWLAISAVADVVDEQYRGLTSSD